MKEAILSTEKHITEKSRNLNLNIENNYKRPNKAIKVIFIILVIFNVIFIFLIGFLLFYFLKIKERKNEKNMINDGNATDSINSNDIFKGNDENSENKKNLIEATYKIKEGQSIFLFNPSELNLKGGDYSIDGEILSENKKNLRNLREIAVENGKYSPTESGYLSIKILFNYNLKSLNYCFKNCKELIKVNLTNFEMEEVVSMDSTFSGCSKLNEINLEGIKNTNIMNKEYTFENCNELRNINLSPIKAIENAKIESIFSGCEIRSH